MKTSRTKSRPKTYSCRKCLRTDFKTPMEFTNHLRNCRGQIQMVTQSGSLAAVIHENGMKDELVRLRTLGIEIQDLADKLLKRFK